MAKLKLPTKKSRISSLLGKYVFLLYGREKIGKTSLASRFPKALFCMFEPGAKAKEVFQMPVNSWTRFRKIVTMLRDDKHDFRTVVIDTVDICFRRCVRHVNKGLGIMHSSEEEWGKGWDLVSEEFQLVVSELTNLGLGVVFISHAEEKQLKTRRSGTVDRVIPTMKKQARKVIEPMVDCWFYLDYLEDANDQIHRVAYCQGTDTISAGDRTNRFPSLIDLGANEEEAYVNLVAAFKGEYTGPSFDDLVPDETPRKRKKKGGIRKKVVARKK